MYNTTSTQALSPDRSATSPTQHKDIAGYHTQLSPLRPAYSVPKALPSSPSNTASTMMNGSDYLAREQRPPSTFYDPTMDGGDRRQRGRAPSHPVPSPSFAHGSLSTQSYRDHRSYNNPQASPVASYHSSTYPTSPPLHPPQRLYHRNHDDNPALTSPARNGQQGQTTRASTFADQVAASPSLPTPRAANPMSFSNILSQSESNTRMSPPTQAQSIHSKEASVHVIERQPEAVATSSTVGQLTGQDTIHPPARYPPETNGILPAAATTATLENPKSAPGDLAISEMTATLTTSPGTHAHVLVQPRKPATTTPVVTEQEYQDAIGEIEAIYRSPLNQPVHKSAWEEYRDRSLKRVRDLDDGEQMRRKLRRIAQVTKYSSMFTAQSSLAKERYRSKYEQDAWREVQNKEIAEEKERKKVMQRNRRRENTKQRAEKEAAENREKALRATDTLEKEKLLREAERAEKKAITTQKLLKGDVGTDARDLSPPPASVDGGVMGSFQVVEEAPQEPPSKKLRVGNRLKKSKEQKQAEKDAAAAAYAASERGEELPVLAPKIEAKPRAPSKKDKEAAAAKEAKNIATAAAAYNQLYESIWKDIARVKIPKLQKVKDNTLLIKQANVRKTAQLAATQARKWQIKTTKSTKDGQARAKRVMREMLVFWKRNEKDERDHRKMAERQELENAKKAEAEREANRQKRKLNFLISQTELYSHFIGKKVKTDEIERSTDDVTAGVVASGEKIKPGQPEAHVVDLPDSVAKLGTKVTNFDDLDFDAEDDSALRQAAMVNAQHAIQEAQDRARAFDKNGKGEEPMSQFDEGEMNFQNPTSLQSMDIEQPSMLTCQLKEYQLKGLNWLVNLYEQGINGILADEMGLGKTVQSISVMAYLAEHHNIWGPFLVIAPASTLHNWQQEISRFVPTLKVLPYWGSAKDRKVLRKYWDRKHITYTKESPFHVLVTSYQLVVMDAPYFQKIRWQYMILDEAQAIKSSQSTRWKSLLSFHCRNRLLLTGTPIQNNMQELWALLHFIMPSLFDSHDEFSEWFSKDIESHAQSNTKLNEDQLKRLHMILKPFMLRRIKKHVQKELGDKIEEDVYCDLTYRQRAYYGNLRNKISILDLIEKAAVGDDQDTATLMNLVMQFRKVCNHPDLFERAEVTSPVSFSYWAETASFLREGSNLEVAYSVRNLVEFIVPRLIGRGGGRLDVAGPDNELAGWRNHFLHDRLSVWTPENILSSMRKNGAFAWLRFVEASAGDVTWAARHGHFERAVQQSSIPIKHDLPRALQDESDTFSNDKSLFQIVKHADASPPLIAGTAGILHDLCNISRSAYANLGLDVIEPCARPAVSAPPIDLYCASRGNVVERQQTFFNKTVRQALYGISEKTELALLNARVPLATLPPCGLLPTPSSRRTRYTKIEIPSMRRFVTDSGKLAKLDMLLAKLKEGGHRVLLYFQMTRMIDLMEEYLTYRNYKYCRLDGSTKLEDRRDTVADFQSRSDIFVFLLSTRAGGLGINLTAADTVIFYDSDWNPTIDSQAMDRAHRLGQTRQVTVYRLITRGTIEERIRKRALQKEEVQRVVISGGAGGAGGAAGGATTVDFNTRSSRENRTKDIAMWLADDDQAAAIERKEAEIAEREAREPDKGAARTSKRKAVAKRKIHEVSMDDIYHEGEGRFDDDGSGGAGKPSGTATPTAAAAADDATAAASGAKRRKGVSKKAKSMREKLAIADGGA